MSEENLYYAQGEYMAPTIEESLGSAKGGRRWYMISGVIILYCCIYLWLHILKTEINVYENGIKGKSMDTNFLVDFFSLFSFRRDDAKVKMSEFHLDYAQIHFVECKGKSLIIGTSTKNHKCYAMNTNEIRDAIIKQKENMHPK